MKEATKLVAFGLLGLGLAGVTGVFAQGFQGSGQTATEQRLRDLEASVANLESLLRRRTDVPGADDRVNRDINLNMRLNNMEQRIQQLGFQITNAQQQSADALRIATQAQSEAQMAQQAARNAAMRIN